MWLHAYNLLVWGVILVESGGYFGSFLYALERVGDMRLNVIQKSDPDYRFFLLISRDAYWLADFPTVDLFLKDGMNEGHQR